MERKKPAYEWIADTGMILSLFALILAGIFMCCAIEKNTPREGESVYCSLAKDYAKVEVKFLKKSGGCWLVEGGNGAKYLVEDDNCAFIQN